MIDYAPTPMELMFWHALALIAGACLLAPLFRKTGLGVVLGYLVAGVAVNLVFSGNFSDHPEELLHFSEFGVVLFLFVIGLELNPQKLWRMRGDIFGLGVIQMLLCGGALAIAALGYGTTLSAAVIIGFGLALSSTAIVMSQLDERHERNTLHGRKAFGILLFQDLAIVPLLLLVALMAPIGGELSVAESATRVAIAVAAIFLLVLAGRFLLDPMFSLLARAGLPEIMTAAALGVVIAAALLMDVAGMSYAMGSFLAGVMLSDSSFRHEVEANIEPFRGLFLGLFFMAVGLSLDLGVIVDNWWLIIALAPVTMAIKMVTIYLTTRAGHNDHNTSVRIALALAQHGEFGFVLFAAAVTTGLLAEAQSAILVSIISLSMALSALTPRLEPVLTRRRVPAAIDEDYSDANGQILIVGFGRFGQIISQPLFAKGVDVTILDNDIDRIHDAGRFGFRVHYGDGSRRDILRMAGIAAVDAVIVCTDKPEVTSNIVATVKGENPGAQVYARSYDRSHAIQLYKLEPTHSVRETFESALMLARHVLVGLGSDDETANGIITDIRARDLKRLKQQATEGLFAGRDQIHTKPVRPEPL